MIVRVRNQDAEYDPPPQCPHVLLRGGTVLAERVDEFEIAVRFVVVGAEHAHGGKKRVPYSTRPVEPAQQEN